jgi:hypothetical protein
MTAFTSHKLLLRAALTVAGAVVLSAGACPIDETSITPPGDPVPTTLAIVSGNNQQQTVGTELANPLVVRLDDQFGDPMAGETVTFAVTQGDGSLATASVQTDANGEASATWTLGITAGTDHQVTATVSGTSVTATFGAQADPDVPAVIGVFDGDGQQALVGNAVATAPAVQVRDQYNNGVPGVEVAFAVTVGGGAVTGALDTTDVAGIARVGSWILGSDGTNALTGTATATGLAGNPANFGATGVLTLFNIEVRFSDSGQTITPTQQQAFLNAAARWTSIIVGDLPDQPLSTPASTCVSAWHPALNETIDDVVIYVIAEAIDGAFGTVGQGGPCRVRSSSLTFFGGMIFDTADLNRLETDGDLEAVIAHEMGHVFGFGTLWDPLGYLQDPTDTLPASPLDTYFNGSAAIAAFDAAGGDTYALGQKVPVENDNTQFGEGSLNGHWRESVFDTELMTPRLDGGVTNQLSAVTAGSMEDIGYTINPGGSDSYALPAPPAAAAPVGRVIMLDDIWRGPIYRVDAAGRVVGLVRRQW